MLMASKHTGETQICSSSLDIPSALQSRTSRRLVRIPTSDPSENRPSPGVSQ